MTFLELLTGCSDFKYEELDTMLKPFDRRWLAVMKGLLAGDGASRRMPQLDAEPERRGGVKIAVWSAAACVTVLLAACGVWFYVVSAKETIPAPKAEVAAVEPIAPTEPLEPEAKRIEFCEQMTKVPEYL